MVGVGDVPGGPDVRVAGAQARVGADATVDGETGGSGRLDDGTSFVFAGVLTLLALLSSGESIARVRRLVRSRLARS